jgi:hypothetical protein
MTCQFFVSASITAGGAPLLDELELEELDELEDEEDELELDELELDVDELDELDDDDELPFWFDPPQAVNNRQNSAPDTRERIFLPNELVAKRLIGVLLFLVAIFNGRYVLVAVYTKNCHSAGFCRLPAENV